MNMAEEQVPAIVQYADDADEAVRATNRAMTVTDAGLPAPVLYQVLGNSRLPAGSVSSRHLNSSPTG